MFEFDFTVTLTAVHPSADLTFLSTLIPELQPVFVASAGADRLNEKGVPLGRKSKLSVWSAPLGKGEFIDSGTTSLSDFLLTHLPSLAVHVDVFHELQKEGQVMLVVDWRGHDTHTAGVISPDVIRKCAELGLALELNICLQH